MEQGEALFISCLPTLGVRLPGCPRGPDSCGDRRIPPHSLLCSVPSFLDDCWGNFTLASFQPACSPNSCSSAEMRVQRLQRRTFTSNIARRPTVLGGLQAYPSYDSCFKVGTTCQARLMTLLNFLEHGKNSTLGKRNTVCKKTTWGSQVY